MTPGDLVKAEGGAMVTMSSNVSLKAKLEGSLGMALFRSCCAGEGMFMSHFDLMAVRCRLSSTCVLNNCRGGHVCRACVKCHWPRRALLEQACRPRAHVNCDIQVMSVHRDAGQSW